MLFTKYSFKFSDIWTLDDNIQLWLEWNSQKFALLIICKEKNMVKNIARKIQERSVVKQSDRRCVGPRDSPLISSLSGLLRQSQSISEAFSLLLVRDLFSAGILLTLQIYFVPSPIKEGDRILNYHKKTKQEVKRNKLLQLRRNWQNRCQSIRNFTRAWV